MKSKIKSWILIIALGVVLGTTIQFVRAWTEPSSTPPTQNVKMPITTGDDQTKSGSLTAKSFKTKGAALVAGEMYTFVGKGIVRNQCACDIDKNAADCSDIIESPGGVFCVDYIRWDTIATIWKAYNSKEMEGIFSGVSLSTGNLKSSSLTTKNFCLGGGVCQTSTWTNVPLTDTSAFDQNCQYRVQVRINSSDLRDPVYYATSVMSDKISFPHADEYSQSHGKNYIRYDNKDTVANENCKSDSCDSANRTVLSIYKSCFNF